MKKQEDEFYEMTEQDVGKAVYQMIAKKWPDFGRGPGPIKAFPPGTAMTRDIGRRIYLRNGELDVETNGERAERLASRGETMKDEFREITQDDVGLALFKAFKKHWVVADFIGRITSLDVGKRVFLREGVLRVESNAQRAARLKDPQAAVEITKLEAVGLVLTTLRNRLSLVSRPQREEALELSKKYEITAADLVEYAVEQVKRNS
jgi:hypothetical protein